MAMKTIRVEGLRDSVRPAEERAWLDGAERDSLDLSVEAVLASAREDTGLDHFGAIDFTERLQLLLAEVGADENVWKAHKKIFRDHCVKAAANRLLIENYWTENPGSHDVAIVRPINVIALPRSGSTHLENLLAADRRLRHLPVYLAAQPAPRPGEQPGPKGAEPRWTRANERWQRLSENAVLAVMHEQSPDHACGENELQVPDFSSYQWEWMANVPKFRDDYFSHDQTPHYLYMRSVLSLLAWQFPSDKRWMLKSNQHSEQLGPLLKTYPDATVVMIHRDPAATLRSLLTMRGMLVKSSQKEPDIDSHVDYWVGRLELMLRSYLRDRHLVPEGQLVEVMFSEIVQDEVNTASSVLERAGLPVTAESLGDLEDYMAISSQNRSARVVYDLEGDFGLDPNELRERFSFYMDAFDIRPEFETGRAT
jgi:hypothetical protein